LKKYYLLAFGVFSLKVNPKCTKSCFVKGDDGATDRTPRYSLAEFYQKNNGATNFKILSSIVFLTFFEFASVMTIVSGYLAATANKQYM